MTADLDKLDARLASITGFDHVQIHGCTRETTDTVQYATIRDLVAAARERDELREAAVAMCNLWFTENAPDGSQHLRKAMLDVRAALNREAGQ